MGAIVERPGILLYTRIRRTPYFHASRRHGVKMYSVYNHFYHPRHYGDPIAEYWDLLNGVTLWDVGVERQVDLSRHVGAVDDCQNAGRVSTLTNLGHREDERCG